MYTNSLSHHGILGMKWGIRRYQNADGSLTEAGKKRYAKSLSKLPTENEIKDDIRSRFSKEDVRILKDKYKKWVEADRAYDKFEQSEQGQKIAANAYKFTLDNLKRTEPSLVRELIKANGGSETGLDRYNAVDDMFFYDRNQAMQKAWKQSNNYVNDIQAFRDYSDYCETICNKLVGKYGKMPLKQLPQIGANIYPSVSNMVHDVASDFIYKDYYYNY